MVNDRINLLHVSLVVGCGFASRHLDEIRILDLERNRHCRRLIGVLARAEPRTSQARRKGREGCRLQNDQTKLTQST